MNYEQKYKEANDKVAARFGTNVAKEIFTDLYESEDERIRKQTLKVLNYYKDEEKAEDRVPTEIDECIAWLEKQEGCEYIKKDWLEHIKQSWYKEGFIDGKYTPKELTINDATTLNELIDFLENGTAKLQHDLTLYANWLKTQFSPNEKQGEQKFSYTTTVETGNGGINALVTRELSTNGCGDEQNPADKAEPIVVRDFNSVFSREKVKEIDKRIEKSQKLYNAKLRDAMRKVEDFPMTD